VTSGDALQVQRALVVDTISWRPHLETSMEIALEARERGARVRYLNLRRLLPATEDGSWLPRAIDLNTLRIGRAKQLLRAAGIEVLEPAPPRADLARVRSTAKQLLESCADNAALSRLQHDGFAELGWGVLSSVVEATRNPFASVRSHPQVVERYLASALLAYRLARAAIREFAPDVVVLFNGRYASTRAVLAAAAVEGARALIHDRGCDRDHYWLASEPIHDPDYVQRCIREFWRPELASAGGEWFQQRRARVEKGWISYTKRQVEAKIPPAMHDGARWIVFFSSSEDELVAVGDKYVNAAFPMQIDAVRAVAAAVQRLPGYRLCLRMHPNIASKSPEQIAFWRGLRIPGAIIVGPEEDFDSYAMLDRAHVACSYGSTMGIEATYWARPSLLLNRSLYDGLDATLNARSSAEIEEFFANPKVFPQLGALMFGAFYAGYGLRHRYYQARDLFRGRILGADLDSSAVRLLRAARASLR
jgi:hypothetical protein